MNGFLIWYLPLIIEKYFGPHILGLIFSITSLLSITTTSLGGLLGDLIGRRLVAILDSILTFIGILLLILGSIYDRFLLLITTLVFYGLASTSNAIIETIIYESVDKNFLGRVISMMFTIGAISASLGSFILGNLITYMKDIVIILLIISSSIYVISSIFLKETIIRRTKLRSFKTKFRDFLNNLINEFKLSRKRILVLVIVTILMSFEVNSTLYLYPTFMEELKVLQKL
jgi:MFS family permease